MDHKPLSDTATDDLLFLPNKVPAQGFSYIAQEQFLSLRHLNGNNLLSVPEFARERDFCKAVLFQGITSRYALLE